MVIYQIFLTALRSLNKHKLRSLLTTLGIIVGVVSIIAVMSIGEGAKHRVKKEIEGLGTNFIIVLGGTPKRLMHKMGSGNLTLKGSDLKAILEECEDIAQASPGINNSAKAIYEGNIWQAIIAGVTDNYIDIRKWDLIKGDFFTEQDVKSSKKVAVLGITVAKELFGKSNPLGKTIRIKKFHSK